MKCPRCRKEIAYAAMKHDACGWVLPSMTVRRPLVKTEAGEKAFAAMRAMLKTRPKAVERPPAAKIEGVEVTPGHGSFCCCELCFPRRMKPNGARAKLAALAAKLKAMA